MKVGWEKGKRGLNWRKREGESTLFWGGVCNAKKTHISLVRHPKQNKKYYRIVPPPPPLNRLPPSPDPPHHVVSQPTTHS